MAKRISIGIVGLHHRPLRHQSRSPFDTVCDKLKELGFDGVELGAFPPHPNPGNPNGPDERVARRDAREVAARRTGGQDGRQGPRLQRHRRQPLGREADQHRRPDQVHRRVPQELANSPRTSAFRAFASIACSRPPSIARSTTTPRWSASCDTWKTCCDIAADNGQYVTWEFEPGFAFNKPSDIVRIHDARRQAELRPACTTPATGRWWASIGARQEGEKEVFANQVEFIRMLDGRINHIHLIDSDNTCHKDATGDDETSRASAVRPRRRSTST